MEGEEGGGAGLGMGRSGLAEGQHIKSEISMMPRRAIGYSNK